jgi:hypothetical protein
VKKSFFFIFLFFISLSIFARKDSTRFSSFRGFYLNTYYPYYTGGNYYDPYEKFSIDYEQYYYDGLTYYSQTPAVGIGGVMSWKGLFIKGDINYWHGTKAINYRSSHSYDMNGNLMDRDPWDNALAPGTKYSKYDDHIHGKLNLNHIDISAALTGNISRRFRMYLGFRMSYIISHSLKAELDRTVKTYQVLYTTSQYWSHDTLLETKNETYSNKNIESAHNVSVNTLGFLNFGFSYNFRIMKQLFMADLVIETSRLSIFENYGFDYGAATFKIAYVFNYSTRFGKKTYYR